MAEPRHFAVRAKGFLRTLVYRKLGESPLGRSRRRESSMISQELIGLMQGLQRHRGLSGAVLDGQREFGDELDKVEQHLSRSLYELAEHHGDKHPILHHAQWQEVVEGWRAARANWRELDFHTNLFVHNEIINGLVGVLQDVSTEFGSHLCVQQGELIKRWPVLIEHLGVLRALGLHYLTHRNDDGDERVARSMREYLALARAEWRRIDATNANPSTMDDTRHLLGRIDRLLNDRASSLTSWGYYAALTQVIDAWYQDLQQQMAEVH